MSTGPSQRRYVAYYAHALRSGLAATGNGSCAVYDISFVPTSADFPPEARAIMSAAGPSGTLGPHGATIEWSEPVIIHGA